MSRLFALVALCLGVSACGGPTTINRPITDGPLIPFDLNLNGRWVGTQVVRTSAGAATTPATVLMITDGNSLRIEGICNDGSGSTTLTESGNDLSWREVTCPIAPECPEGRFVYSRGEAIVANGVAVVSMQGTVSRCDGTQDWVNFTRVLTKQN